MSPATEARVAHLVLAACGLWVALAAAAPVVGLAFWAFGS